MARRNRPRNTARGATGVAVSNFTLKRTQQEKGEIPVFQFTEDPRREAHVPHVKTTPTVRIFKDTRRCPRKDTSAVVVRATVTNIRRLSDGYVFLTDTDGRAIYLSMKVWDEAHSKLAIPVGTVIECEIYQDSYAKNPRATHILFVDPA